MSELVPIEGEVVEVMAAAPANLFGVSDAAEVIARASAVAEQLADVLKEKGLTSNISGREYVRVEGWTLLGSMLGVFPVCVWSRKLEVDGWEARVEARTLSGQIVGAAESQCLKSERNWKNRDDFAVRSMAQTRATAKALRLPLGFVVSLAGYDPTPAEEIDRGSADAEGSFDETAQAAMDGKRQKLTDELVELHTALGADIPNLRRQIAENASAEKLPGHVAWLERGVKTAKKNLETLAAEEAAREAQGVLT